MTKLINFYYENKKKIIISLSLVITIIIGLLFFYLINNRFKGNKEIVSKEVVKQSSNTNEKVEIPRLTTNKIYVDIKGEVVNPGVYSLDEGSRVIDAIKISGGLTENAYTRYLNMSKVLTDENVIIINNLSEIEEIKNNKNKEIIKETDNTVSINKEEVITNDYKKPKEEETTKSDELNTLVNINTANLEELSKINGIGESTAKKIIDYREKNGEFKTIEDIMNVSGIGEKKYDQIKEYITIK